MNKSRRRDGVGNANQFVGDSVGRYEGETLVVDTVGVKMGPFAMVDMYGTPFSPALHVVERYRLLDYADAEGGDRRDEGVFTVPWTATITYSVPLGSWEEHVCAESRR